MADIEPAWSLTDDALTLILHAENEVIEDASDSQLRVRRMTRKLGGVMNNQLWLQEAAVLRLISTVEMYTNAASEFVVSKGSYSKSKLPFTWDDRKKHYRKIHLIELQDCHGWDRIDAGVNLRNCLAHGLGNLTEKLLSDKGLGKKMKDIDVTVSGGKMHTTTTTVPKLADGCRAFVCELEGRLVQRLQQI